MAQDVSAAIRSEVANHYDKSNDILLLSELGKLLRTKGDWPSPEDQRPLAQIVTELSPEIILQRDPQVAAYVAVVPAGKETLAEQAIERRRISRQLSKVARPILLAFCLKDPNGETVYVRPTPPFRYHVGAPPDDGFIPVEDRFRSPGVYVDDPSTLSPDDAGKLVGNIEKWANEHGVQLDQLSAERRGERPVPLAPSQIPTATKNALERLYEAQPPTLRDKVVMPFDIAVYLSRMP